MQTHLLVSLPLVVALFFGAAPVGAQEDGAAPALDEADLSVVAEQFVVDGQLDVAAVVDYFEDLYRADSSVSEAELIVVRPRRTRRMRMRAWTEGEDKALIVILGPARYKGMATLKVDRNLWRYEPRIRTTIRIAPSMMLGSWMGSDFTNDDLVRESSLTEDYTYRLAGRHEDPEGWLITFDAKPGIVGLWNRFELVVSPDGTLPLLARYYDRRDRLARTLTWDRVTVFDGRRIPARLVLVPEDEEGHRTEMVYESLTFGVDIPPATFSLSRLESGRVE